MKSLKRTIRDSKAKVGGVVEKFLHPLMSKAGMRMRIAPRIRLLNRKAAKNPKRTFAIVFSTLLILFLSDLAVSFLRPSPASQPNMNIATVDSVFDGFREIQANKEMHRQAVAEMTLAGKNMRHRLDSLIAIPNKNKADSIEIQLCYRRLERIVRYLKPDGSGNPI